MNDFQHIWEQIQVRHNLVTYFMVAGILLGLMLSLAIALKTSPKNRPLRFLGWFLFLQTIVALDVFLCYSGFMKYTLHLNDSTEPLVLLLAPILYLFVYELLSRETMVFRKYWYHFLPSVIYAISQVGYYLHPLPVKMNAYVDAYFEELPMVQVPEGITYPYQIIKDEFRWLILGSFVLYIILSLKILIKFAKSRNTYGQTKGISKYLFSKNTVFTLIIIFVVILTIFLNYDDDGGDHYIAIMQSTIVLFTAFLFLIESRFFENSWIADKYETLRIREDGITIKDVISTVTAQAFFLNQQATLKELATLLGTNPNYLSKIINSGTGMNFNDFINQYRVEEAKSKLLDPEYANLTVAAIGNSVGFTSKSAFYTAFKKHAKISPSAFIKLHKTK